VILRVFEKNPRLCEK